MNDQFIQGVIFDWDKIDKDSYLKEIRAFKGVEKLDFNKPMVLCQDLVQVKIRNFSLF